MFSCSGNQKKHHSVIPLHNSVRALSVPGVIGQTIGLKIGLDTQEKKATYRFCCWSICKAAWIQGNLVINALPSTPPSPLVIALVPLITRMQIMHAKHLLPGFSQIRRIAFVASCKHSSTLNLFDLPAYHYVRSKFRILSRSPTHVLNPSRMHCETRQWEPCWDIVGRCRR